jgi:hypothetical protein
MLVRHYATRASDIVNFFGTPVASTFAVMNYAHDTGCKVKSPIGTPSERGFPDPYTCDIGNPSAVHF